MTATNDPVAGAMQGKSEKAGRVSEHRAVGGIFLPETEVKNVPDPTKAHSQTGSEKTSRLMVGKATPLSRCVR
jgi:hypothetical protein